MNITTYTRNLRSGATPSASVSDLCGRIIRGTKPDDFKTLTDDPTRKLVMLMGSDGLAKLLGRTGYDMLVEIGYEPEYIVHKVNQGNQFKLVVFGEGGAAKLATWQNTAEVVGATYPDVADMIRAKLGELKRTSFDEIERRAGFDFSEVDKLGSSDPRFMTHERFRNSRGTLVDVRAFLYFSVHLRELFSGDGYTYTADGRRGLMEYIVPNKPLAQLGQHEVVDIDVRVPKLPSASSSRIITLPLPDHYDPLQATDHTYAPNIGELMVAAEAFRKGHGFKMVGADRRRVHLLVIDDQGDFSFPQGSLYVGGRSGTGAMDDQRRLVEFIYRYLALISEITCTMDSHIPFQVFFNSAHLKADGTHPAENTVIMADEYRNGVYRPNPAMAKQIGIDPVWLGRQFTHYCSELEKAGKPPLYLWPYHCLIGTAGHRLAGVIDAARLFHAFARGAKNIPEIKGGNPLTEHYSIFSPEVTTLFTGDPIPGAQKNAKLLKKLMAGDVVIIAGQASSHCVRTSIEDFLSEIMAQDPELVRKVYILRDCTSAVVVPGIVDFTDDAEDAFAKFAAAGMHVVDSTTPIEDWPQINL
jgi:nicotinamidase-related amidase